MSVSAPSLHRESTDSLIEILALRYLMMCILYDKSQHLCRQGMTAYPDVGKGHLLLHMLIRVFFNEVLLHLIFIVYNYISLQT